MGLSGGAGLNASAILAAAAGKPTTTRPSKIQDKRYLAEAIHDLGELGVETILHLYCDTLGEAERAVLKTFSDPWARYRTVFDEQGGKQYVYFMESGRVVRDVFKYPLDPIWL